MTIEEILKEQQPKEHKKLKKEVLTEKDIKELMDHRYYRRTKRGRIKQIYRKNTY